MQFPPPSRDRQEDEETVKHLLGECSPLFLLNAYVSYVPHISVMRNYR